jgi:hypothetical protein
MTERFDNQFQRRDPNRRRNFQRRPGALDRRWGIDRRATSEGEYPDEYNAPDHWTYQQAWLKPGPFTGRGPRGYRKPDQSIYEEVCERLAQHAQIDASHIEVKVDQGEVTVTGSVPDRRTKRMVETNVELISGVIDVHNQLRLSNRAEREREQEQHEEETLENPFPGGPPPTGNAGY